MGNSAIRCYLGVDVTTLLLVEVDLCLQDLDLLRLRLQLGAEDVLLHLNVTLLLLILVVEDLLVGAVELAVELQLLRAELLDQVQQVGVHRDFTRQVALRRGQVSLSILLLAVASLLHLVELVLEVENDLRRPGDFERVEVDNIAEPKHLALAVLSLLLFKLLVELADLLFLLLEVVLSLDLLLLERDNFFVQLELAVDELKELGAGEEDGPVEGLGHNVASPVFRGEGFSTLLINVLLAVNLSFGVLDVDMTLKDVLFALEELLLAHRKPSLNGVAVWNQILDLFDLEDNGHVELVELGHLLLLEVFYLLFCLLQFLVDVLLFAFHALLLVLEVTNEKLDGFFLVEEGQTGVAKTFNFVNLHVLAKLWVEVVVIIVVVVFFDLFLFGFVTILIAIWVILLHPFWLSSLLGDLLIEGQDLIVHLVIGVHEFVELGQQLCFFLFDVLHLGTFGDQLTRDILDLLDDETLLLGALFEFIGETHVFRLHRLEQDQLFEQQQQLQLGALQVTLKTIFLLLHFFDLLVEVVDLGVDVVHELSLLVLQLNHAHLLHLFVDLSELLRATLTVCHSDVVRINFFLFFTTCSIALFFLRGFLRVGLVLGLLLCLGLLLLLLLAALTFVLLLCIDLSLLQIRPVVLDVLIGHIEGLFGVLDFLVDFGKD